MCLGGLSIPLGKAERAHSAARQSQRVVGGGGCRWVWVCHRAHVSGLKRTLNKSRHMCPFPPRVLKVGKLRAKKGRTRSSRIPLLKQGKVCSGVHRIRTLLPRKLNQYSFTPTTKSSNNRYYRNDREEKRLLTRRLKHDDWET